MMETYEIINQTLDCIDNMKKNSAYLSLKEKAEAVNDNCKELIETFTEAKTKYYEVMKYGKHHPDYQEAVQKLTNAKTMLYQNQFYQAYLNELTSFNQELSIFNEALNEVMSACLMDQNKHCVKG